MCVCVCGSGCGCLLVYALAAGERNAWREGRSGFPTIAAFICGNHLTAGRAPVFTNVVYLAPVGIIPKREELAFRIRQTLGPAIVKSWRFSVPQSPCVPLVFLNKTQSICFPGFDQLETV